MEYENKIEKLQTENVLLKQKLENIRNAVNVKFHNLGDEFFAKLVENLFHSLDADFTFVGKLINEREIHTISFYGKKGHLPNFSYHLDGTPCDTVVDNKICIYSDEVYKKFPQDKGLEELGIEGYCGVPLFNSKSQPTGIIVALFEKPIIHHDLAEIILLSYAQKAGSELEHQENSHTIKQINASLVDQNKKLKVSEKINITLKDRIEFALKASHSAWFEITFPEGTLSFNKDLSTSLGLKLDQVQTLDDFRKFIHPDQRKSSLELIQKFLDQERTEFQRRILLKTHNNAFQWFQITGQKKIVDHKNGEVKVIGLIEDISVQIKNEKINKELESKYHHLVHNFPNGGILLYDHELRIQLSGGPELENAGFDHENIVGKTIYDIFPEDVCKVIEPAYLDSLRGKETTLELEFLDNWHKTINIPYRDLSGNIVGGIVMTQYITQQKKITKQLATERHRFQSLIESTNIVAWELNLKTKSFTYISPQVGSLSGYSVEEWTNFDFWASILHDDDRERAVNYCNKQTTAGSDHRIEYRILSKDKKIKWINDIVTVIKEDEKPTYLRGFFIDITDQKISEINLKDSEERFRKVFETSPDSININKLDGTYVEINSGFTRITGYEERDVIGKLSSEINIWADLKDRERLVKELMEKGRAINLEAKFRMKNGNIRVCLMSASIIELNNEDHIISITRDVTERKKIRAKLEESERKYRNTFEAINEGLWEWDLINDKGSYSESLYKMLGYKPEDIENTNEAWGKLIHPDDIESCNHAVQMHLTGEISEFAIEFRLKTKMAAYKWVKAKGKVMEFTDDGKPKRILGAIEDIDSIKKAELDLEVSYVKYKTLADYTYDWEYWKDPDNNYLYVSPSSERITGYKASSFLKSNKQFGSIVYKDDIDIWNKHEHNSMGKHIPCATPIEFRIVKKDGTIAWINHVCQPVYDDKGKYIGNRGTNRDITQQKNVQFELMASESKYRMLFENMTSGFALHEMIYNQKGDAIDYRFIDVNPAFEKLTGLKRKDIINKRVREIMPNTEDYWIENYGEITKTGNSKYYENYSKELEKHFSTYVFSPEANKFAVVFHDITEKKQIEDELVKSENKLKLHLEQTPLGVIEWGLNSEILSWNKAAEKIFGYNAKEIYGKIGIKQLVPDLLHEEIKYVWENTLKKGNKRHTNKNITKDGKIIICDWHNTTIVNEEDEIIGVISMVEDVTEREKIQRDLRKNEERHKMISRIASDYVYSVKVAPEKGLNAIDWVSGGFTRITGYTVEEINRLKEKWDSIIHPEDQIKIKNNSKKIKLPVSRTEEYRIITRNGMVKWVSDNYLPMQSAQGKVVGYLGSITDITERKLAEESLRRSETRLQRLAEISEEGLIVFHRSKIIEVNKAVPKITGYSEDELIGQKIIHLIDQADIPSFTHHLQKKGDFPFVVKANKKSSEVFHMEFHIKPYEFQGKACLVASIKDVSVRIETEKALRQKEAYLQQAQKIAHIGYWHWDMVNDEYYIAEELRNIYELADKEYKFIELFEASTCEEHKNRLLNSWNESEKTGRKFDEEFKIKAKGQIKWLRVVAEITRDELGSPISATGLSYDITDRKSAEIEIKKLNQAIEQSFACIVITDTEGKIKYANPRLYQLTGYTPDEVIGQNPRVLSAGTLSADYYQNMWEQISDGKTWQGEFHNKKKNGEAFWESATISPVMNEIGEISHFIAVKDDITEKKLADRKIQENNQQLIQLNEQIANYKMMALRSVMNPHFIFNCLNSIQFFIAKNEKKPAISYLSLFSKLMRNVLNSSVERYVSLRTEIETLEYYIKLEKLRFDDNFDFVLKIDEELDMDNIEIPSMVIQPYIENAIIHGLSNKHDTGTLMLKIHQEDSAIVCVVEDDGIGREASMKLHQDLRLKHKSYGMTVTEERLNIINKTHNVQVEIIDLEEKGNPAEPG